MDNKELEEKIKQLDYVANNLESQVYALKAEIRKLNDEKAKLEAEKNNQIVYGKPDYKVEESVNQNNNIPVTVNSNSVDSSYPEAYSYGKTINVVNSGKEKDFEHWFGKNMMSIIASLLIFISIIIFSTVFYPNLTDEIKVLAMFIFSIGVSVFGYLGVRKNAKDTFKIAVMACGIGCIFVSLLVTRIYFEMLSDSALLILVLLWAALVCYLSKFSNALFIIIGQIGIIVTLLTGITNLKLKYSDINIKYDQLLEGNVIYALFIAFILGEIMMYFSGKKNKTSVLANHTGLAWGVFLLFINFNRLSLKYFNMIGSEYEITSLIDIIVIICALVYIMWNKDESLYDINSIFVSIFGFILSICILSFVSYNTNSRENQTGCIICSIVLLALLMIYAFNYTKDRTTHRITVLFLSIILLFDIGVVNEMWTIALTFIFILAFEYMGFARKDKAFQWMAVWSPFAYVLNMDSYPGLTLLFIMLITFTIPYLMYRFKQKHTYSTFYKIVLYIEFLFFFAVLFEAFGKKIEISREYLSLIKYIIVSLASVFAMKTDYSKSFIDGSEEMDFKVTTYIINGIIMISGLTHIMRYNYNPMVHFMYTLVVLTLYSVNSVTLFDEYESRLVHAYVGLKYTILITVIFKSFEAEDIIISIVNILVACVCVILGFMIYKKGLRIYGLWLAIIFVFKLILVDMTYDEPIAKAIGFLVAGVICFAISALYNYAEDKMG